MESQSNVVYNKEIIYDDTYKKDMFEPGSIFEPEDFIDISKEIYLRN